MIGITIERKRIRRSEVEMTPDKLREKGNRWRELGQYDLANIYNQHAAALEEIERLNAAWKAQHAAWKAQQFHLEAEERESAHWKERAEKAERRAERLKGHADRMRQILTIGDGGFPCLAVADYDAEFKGEK